MTTLTKTQLNQILSALDGQPRRGREVKEAALIIARNMGRPTREVKVLQWSRLH